VKEEDKKKANSKTITGSMRIRASFALPDFVTNMANMANLDLKTMKKKKAGTTVTASEMNERMKRIFTEINPEDLPETVTQPDENGVPVLIRTMREGKYQITAGTADALVECLADHHQPDSLYIDIFLQTYRNFMTPSVLLEKLRTRFVAKNWRVTHTTSPNKDPENDGKHNEFIDLDAEKLQLVKVRIASILKKWVERHWYDFEVTETFTELTAFLEQMKEQKCEGIAQQIYNTIHRNKEEAERKRQNLPMFPENKPVVGLDLVDVAPKEIAQHLTLVSVDLLRAIAPDEFVFFLWGKKSNPLTAQLTRNLQRLIDRFNKVGFWVATEICACSDIKKRITLMEKFVSVAKHLMRLQNFNDVLAVLSGLQTIPIYRLKNTWKGLSQKSMTVFKELEAKMDPKINYKSYRQIEFEAKPPYIPFFGLYTRDLTFMNDGNQTYLNNNMVNFEKHRSIMGAIMSIRSSQQSVYSFDVNPHLLKYCEVIYNKEEEELIQESNMLEPPTRRRASIASIGSEISASTNDYVADDSSSVADQND